MKAKERHEFSLSPWCYEVLDGVAKEKNFRLAPQHAARAGREWDWAMAIECVVSEFSVSQEKIDSIVDALNSLLSPFDASCGYEDGKVWFCAADGQRYERKLT